MCYYCEKELANIKEAKGLSTALEHIFLSDCSVIHMLLYVIYPVETSKSSWCLWMDWHLFDAIMLLHVLLGMTVSVILAPLYVHSVKITVRTLVATYRCINLKYLKKIIFDVDDQYLIRYLHAKNKLVQLWRSVVEDVFTLEITIIPNF